jgi:hypothetical protein
VPSAPATRWSPSAARSRPRRSRSSASSTIKRHLELDPWLRPDAPFVTAGRGDGRAVRGGDTPSGIDPGSGRRLPPPTGATLCSVHNPCAGFAERRAAAVDALETASRTSRRCAAGRNAGADGGAAGNGAGRAARPARDRAGRGRTRRRGPHEGRRRLPRSAGARNGILRARRARRQHRAGLGAGLRITAPTAGGNAGSAAARGARCARRGARRRTPARARPGWAASAPPSPRSRCKGAW